MVSRFGSPPREIEPSQPKQTLTTRANTAPATTQGVYIGTSSPKLADIKTAGDRLVRQAEARAQTVQLAEAWQRVPLTFADYTEAVKNFNSWQQRVRREQEDGPKAHLPHDGPPLRRFLSRFDRSRHTPDLDGWLQHLADYGLKFDTSTAPQHPIMFPAQPREEHTLIAGSSGAGKSELLKALVFHHLTATSDGVVVLDPDGKLVREIAHWPEFAAEHAARLVYLRFDPDAGAVPVFNPMHRPSLSPHARANYARYIGEVIDQLQKSDLTSRMRTLITYCARVLLDRQDPPSTLRDLRSMLLDDDAAQPLADLGRRHPDPDVAEYFARMFDDPDLAPTRKAVAHRLFDVFQSPAFGAITSGPDQGKLDVLKLADEGRVILVDLDSLGDASGIVFGRFIAAELFAHAMRRDFTGSRPIHLFADEAQRLISPSFIRLLQDTRKRGLHLTLAQQEAGAGFGDMQNTLFINTAIKFQGLGSRVPRMTHELGLDDETWQRIFPKGADARGVFACRWGRNADTITVHVRSDLATRTVSELTWENVLRVQRDRYYSSTRPQPVAPPPARQRRPLED